MEEEHADSQSAATSGPDAAPPASDASMWARARVRRRRFLDKYEARRAQRQRGEVHPLARPMRVTTGVVLILAGVAIGWLPGPGFVILAFPGALLIASEWRRAALLMDRMENETIPRIRLLRARLRGGPRPEWVEEDPQLWGIWEDRRAAGRDGSEAEIVDTGERRRRSDKRRADAPDDGHDDEDDARSA